MQKVKEFNSYPSIENSSLTKFVNTIKKQNLTSPEIIWCALQKIHGANFSVYCDGKFVRYGRRKDYISKQIPVEQKNIEQYFVEKFFDCHKVVIKFHKDLSKIYQNLKKVYETIQSFTLYGEYFGGAWSQPTAVPTVQWGVLYTPNHQYFVFDIRVTLLDNSQLWIPVLQLQKYTQKYVPIVPISKVGNFDELMDIDTKTDSMIPDLLGLKHLENNMIQGLVIRPNQNYTISHKRVILKKKNKQFVQKVGHKMPAEQKKKIDPTMLEYAQLFDAYINVNRVQSARSKLPDADLKTLKQQIYDDILADAEKDEVDIPKGDKIGKMNKYLYSRILAEIQNAKIKFQ